MSGKQSLGIKDKAEKLKLHRGKDEQIREKFGR